MATFLSSLLRDDPGKYRLINERAGTVVAEHLLTAFDSATRNTGLLKHTAMPDHTALIIAPSNAIHTFFMKFSIDVLFVRKDGEVGKIRAAMPPWRLAAALRSWAVIELRAGTVGEAGIVTGDRLVVRSRSAT